MGTTDTLLPEAVAAEAETGAAVLTCHGPAHLHLLNVGGQNARAALLTDQRGNRLIFHAISEVGRLIGRGKQNSWSEAAIAIPFTTGGFVAPRKADVRLLCGWLGLADQAKKDWLISGSYGRWRAVIEAGVKLSSGQSFAEPLAKKRLLAKVEGEWEPEPITGETEAQIAVFEQLHDPDRARLAPVDHAFDLVAARFDALERNLKARWLGAVTFPNLILEPDTRYEAFVKVKADSVAKASSLASAFAYVDFNPDVPCFDNEQIAGSFGLYLNAVSCIWRRPGVHYFEALGDLINNWYWLRKDGARADWMFKDVDKARVKDHLWATLKPMVVTTFNGTPTATEIGTSVTGKLRVEHDKPVRFAVPKEKITAHGLLPISITWLGKDCNDDGLAEHVAVNAGALTLDYD